MADRQVTVKVAIRPTEESPLRKVFDKIRSESLATERRISADLAKVRDSYVPFFKGLSPSLSGGGVGASLAKAFGGPGAYGGLHAPDVISGKLGAIRAPTSGIAGIATKLLGGSAGATFGPSLAAGASAFGLVATAGTAAAAVLHKVWGELKAMASLASPAHAAHLKMAQEDLNAVIGRSAIPLLELETRLTRNWADGLAAILPSAAGARDALRGFTESLELVQQAGIGLGESLAESAGGALYHNVQLQGGFLRFLTQATLFPILSQLGLGGAEAAADRRNKSLGAAPRPASISTDITSFLRGTYAETFSQIPFGSGTKSTAERQADAAEKSLAEQKEQNKLLTKLYESFTTQGGVGQSVFQASIRGILGY